MTAPTKNIIACLIALAMTIIIAIPACPQAPAGPPVASVPPETPGQPATPAQAPSPLQLSRLGSRMTIVPEPLRNRIRVLPLGHCFTEFTGLTLSITADDRTILFPPADPAAAAAIHPLLTPTSIAWSIPVPGSPDDPPARLEYRLISPLTPQIRKWRSAPVMLIELTLTNPGTRAITCDIALSGLTDQPHRIGTTPEAILVSTPLIIPIDQQSVINYEIRDYLAPHLQPPVAETPETSGFSSVINGTFTMTVPRADGWLAELKLGTGRLLVPMTAPANGSTRTFCAVTFHTVSPVLSVDGSPRPFAYTADFPRPEDLAEQALQHARNLIDADAAIRTLLDGSTFGASGTHRAASVDSGTGGGSIDPTFETLRLIALQSFLANTWLVRNPDGSTRYSEWEGFPLFHSTLDVVFNTSLFHLAFTPDLLANMLMHWPRYHQDGDMPHDMGKGLVIDRNTYPVQMTVEENTNYLLLHAMLAARTGNTATAEAQRDTIEDLVRRLIASDTDGDLLPDTGVINTFDDAPPSVNSAPNQVYLGIKTAAALQAVAEVLGPVVSTDIRSAALDRSRGIYEAVERSWTGTHFPISLPLRNPAASAPAGKITGVLLPLDPDRPIGTSGTDPGNSDGYCNYAAHGLVALWLCRLNAPDDLETRMRVHLAAAHEKTATPYGDSHRDGHPNVWVSQNMWRDLAARYLGVDLDFTGQHQKYMKLQQEALNHRGGTCRWEGFCDSPENSFLTCYSRGIPIMAFPWFQLGRIDWPALLPNETDFR